MEPYCISPKKRSQHEMLLRLQLVYTRFARAHIFNGDHPKICEWFGENVAVNYFFVKCKWLANIRLNHNFVGNLSVTLVQNCETEDAIRFVKSLSSA